MADDEKPTDITESAPAPEARASVDNIRRRPPRAKTRRRETARNLRNGPGYGRAALAATEPNAETPRPASDARYADEPPAPSRRSRRPTRPTSRPP